MLQRRKASSCVWINVIRSSTVSVCCYVISLLLTDGAVSAPLKKANIHVIFQSALVQLVFSLN